MGIIFFDYNFPLNHDANFQAEVSSDVVRTVLSNQNAMKVCSEVHTADMKKITEGPLSTYESELRSYVLLDDGRFATCKGCTSDSASANTKTYELTPNDKEWDVITCPTYMRYYGSKSAAKIAEIKMREDPDDVFQVRDHDFTKFIPEKPWIKDPTPMQLACAEQHSWLNKPDTVSSTGYYNV